MSFADDRDSLFDAAPDDGGLSLEDLSQAFADLLRQGDDPYEDVAEEDVPELEGATPANEGAIASRRRGGCGMRVSPSWLSDCRRRPLRRPRGDMRQGREPFRRSGR